MNEQHTIIWDWNGSLLDDVHICISSMNRMLKTRRLPELSLESYREVFTFPVMDYYTAIGFDFTKEPWDEAALEFIILYLESLPSCGLAENAVETLDFFRAKGYRQAIISAMQHEALLQSVDALGITDYFDYIGGIGDHYGTGKIENAQQYFSQNNLRADKVTLIGDTLHDAEVASELGCQCILVASGHQSAGRLKSTGIPILSSLAGIIPYFMVDSENINKI